MNDKESLTETNIFDYHNPKREIILSYSNRNSDKSK